MTSARAAVVVVLKPAHLNRANLKLQHESGSGWCSSVSHVGDLSKSTLNSCCKVAYRSTTDSTSGGPSLDRSREFCLIGQLEVVILKLVHLRKTKH